MLISPHFSPTFRRFIKITAFGWKIRFDYGRPFDQAKSGLRPVFSVRQRLIQIAAPVSGTVAEVREREIIEKKVQPHRAVER